MIEPDISARDALALLSTRDIDPRDRTPEGMNRRRFLQMIGWGVGGGAVLSGLNAGIMPELMPDEWRQAFAAGPLGPGQGVLVIVGMYGGNDGLNTVVPYTNGKYRDYRTNIAIPTAQLHLLNGEFGLHPNLPYLKALYDNQQLAVVHGLGYPNPDFSHFNSMANWMSGRVGGSPSSGWIGRWLDGLGGADLYSAATIGTSLPLHLVGQTRRGTAVPENGFKFGADTKDTDLRAYEGIKGFSAASAGRGQWHDALAGASRGQIDMAQRLAPVFAAKVETNSLAKQLVVAARLINADLGFRVLDTSLETFDHHSNEPDEHATKMSQLNDGIEAFFTTLDPKFADRVTVMTFSEFGRTPWSNDSRGTDHGTSNAHFVIGGNVKGGLYGTPPSLLKSNGTAIDRWGRMDHTMDFRSLYATMIDGLLGGGSSTVLGGNYETLDLFRPAGSPIAAFPAGTGGPSTFVGITPARILDTRAGDGGPIGPDAAITLQVTGAGGVPAGAVGAVLNVTGVLGTEASYLTVWPSSLAKPDTSTLNTIGGDVVPNLAITKLSSGGQVNVYNFAGSTHCVIDVVGYFVKDGGSRFTSLSPARILDTREGVGASAGAVGQGASIDLQVTGAGGVVGDADAVVMNVTVTEPTIAGFVTVWPTGGEMPTASNLNFVAGQTAPNLVVAKLGADGKVSLFNSAGSTHLIADVLGYFRSGDGAEMVPLAPSRLLDTRSDFGPPRPVGQDALSLPVLSHGGVPSSGVSAVVLNVTATEGTSSGFVTVYPGGEDRPWASNLNTNAGQTRANLVISKVGSDGTVAMFNSVGQVHLVADVVGYFTA